MLTLDIHGTSDCSDVPLHSEAVAIDDMQIERIKRGKPKGGLKPPATARLRTVVGVDAVAENTFLKVTGSGIVPVGAACQAQAVGKSGPTGPQGADGTFSTSGCTWITSDPVVLPSSGATEVTASCPNGETAVSGGPWASSLNASVPCIPVSSFGGLGSPPIGNEWSVKWISTSSNCQFWTVMTRALCCP